MRLMCNYLQRYHHVYAQIIFHVCTFGRSNPTGRHIPVWHDACHPQRVPEGPRESCPAGAGDSVKWSSDTSVMLCKWRDKRDIFLISTNDAGGDNEVEVRRKGQLVTLCTEVQVPGWSGRMDQLRSYYGVVRTGRRWWKYVFWGIMNIAQNLWTLCNRPLPANERLFSLKSFKMKLIHNLADDFRTNLAIIRLAIT